MVTIKAQTLIAGTQKRLQHVHVAQGTGDKRCGKAVVSRITTTAHAAAHWAECSYTPCRGLSGRTMSSALNTPNGEHTDLTTPARWVCSPVRGAQVGTGSSQSNLQVTGTTLVILRLLDVEQCSIVGCQGWDDRKCTHEKPQRLHMFHVLRPLPWSV